MRRPLVLALCATLLAGVGVVAAIAGDPGPERQESSKPQRVQHEGGPRATHLLVSSRGRRRIVAAESFCASGNGEPISLACGPKVRAVRGPALSARPGAVVTLRFGTAVRDAAVRYARVEKDGRVTALTYAAILRFPRDDGHVWKLVTSRDPSMRRGRLVALISAAYRDPIALDVRGRQTKPFTAAFAEFALPLRIEP